MSILNKHAMLYRTLHLGYTSSKVEHKLLALLMNATRRIDQGKNLEKKQLTTALFDLGSK